MAGFTYVGVLVLVAVLAIVSATTLQIGKVMHRRLAEEALLDVGLEFGAALESYRRATPAGQPDAPREMNELLRDPRFPGTVRHLRKLFDDPMTGRPEWGLVRSEGTQRIEGVYSLSKARPIKVGNFDLRLQAFAGASSYQEWIFTHLQSTAGAAGQNTRGGFINPRFQLGSEDAAPASPNASGTQTPSVAPENPGGLISPRDLM